MISIIPQAGWALMIAAVAVSRLRVAIAIVAGFFVLSILGLGRRSVIPSRTGLVTALISAVLNENMI